MEIDQVLFKKVFKYFDKWKKRNSHEEFSRTIELKDISSRLTLIARALTGDNIDIFPAEKEGGWKGTTFYLPTTFGLLPSLEGNLNFYIYRIVYLSIQREEGLNWEGKDTPQSIEDSRHKAHENSDAILNRMEEEYTPVFEFYSSIGQYFPELENISFWLFGKYMSNRDVFENGEGADFSNSPDEKGESNPSTEIKSKAVEEVEVVAVDKKAQEDFTLLHNFEKVETIEEFSGLWRGFDGDDTLQEDEDALDEVSLSHLVRTDEVANSIYQADFRDLANIAESGMAEDDGVFRSYQEWDLAKKAYKPDYCKVFLKKITGGDLTYAQTCIAENTKNLNALRRKFSQIHQDRISVKKLKDGESIDIDALVDWFTELKSGRTPSDNIYLSKRKRKPDLAILFLLDLSLSTDSYADGNRVLDIEKQAVILFGEVLTEYNVDFAVSGFYSKTRNNCVYHSLKEFGESWTKGKQKIGAVEPQGYTRIGPALRHSKTLIESHAARQKWVILLSDGKPNDYDKYEGKYGVADVKQALREMHERHINTYAIAVESVARYYLPQMFGQNHYNILSNTNMLIPSLAMLYRRINNS